MMQSGVLLSWDSIKDPIVDKHSTGGVGDKISLILAPVLASLGLKVPMISGRGLGHTGGTLDKLQSIPGYRVELSEDEMKAQLRRVGMFIAGQTPRMVPADRRLYALRDVTATVESPPLIVSSILSKKAAAGLQYLVLDVKFGEGAFMQTLSAAEDLAGKLVHTARELGLEAVAVLTRMEGVLGSTVGNAVEVEESIRMLMGEEPAPDLQELVEVLGGVLLVQVGRTRDLAAGRRAVRDAVRSGRALAVLGEWIRSQGCPLDPADLLAALPKSPEIMTVCAESDGYLAALKGRQIGILLGTIGGGRLRADDMIAPGVGVRLLKKVGDNVNAGDPLLEIYHETRQKPDPHQWRQLAVVAPDPPETKPLIAGFVSAAGRSDSLRI
jgi:pyrimidine-nucleoside phosphorylase